MKAIKFKVRCNFNNKTYKVGEETTNFTKDDIAVIQRLNEKGFIEPLTQKELKKIANGSFFVKAKKTEEE